MKFAVKKPRENISVLLRRLGYRPISTREQEFSYAKSLLGRDYPRFHLYIKKEEDAFIFNLHLDQKKPSYKGIPLHSGEYEGPLVAKEAERIKVFFGQDRDVSGQ